MTILMPFHPSGPEIPQILDIHKEEIKRSKRKL
jgi:hypothetical protein